MDELLKYVPEVIVVGNIEFAIAGAAVGLGFPKIAAKIVEKRTGTDLNGDGVVGFDADNQSEPTESQLDDAADGGADETERKT